MGLFESVYTKSALKKGLKKNRILVDGKIATSATYIMGGETIELLESKKEMDFKKLNLDLKVLFEDDYLAIIHKPPGILVNGNSFKTVSNALTQNLKPSTLSDATQPKPVHRLDFPTTGVLLVGKTNFSIRILNKLFENNEVEKVYFAVTIGEMNSEGEISSPIDEKEALTKYKVKKSVFSKKFGCLNLVELNPVTGRRHQLRKHLACHGNPILGDKEYVFENLILWRHGLYLHAFSLRITHPWTKNELYIEDEIPEKFTKIFKD